MFEFIFGIIWELVSFPILIIAIYNTMTEGFLFAGVLWIFAIIFNGIGFFMLGIGIRRLLRDSNTNKYGEECYGKVVDVFPNGNTINGRRQYDALVEVFVNSLNQTVEAKELSGTGKSEYDIGDYVKVKYYDGDINFVEKVYPDYLPVAAREAISKAVPTTTPKGAIPQQTIIYESSDVIIVDGVRYKRMD